MKLSPIKWRDKDIKKLQTRVRAFNAKRTRLLKQVPELEDFLPAKQNVKDLKNNIYTRRDFNNTIKRLNRFMAKNATDVIVTKEGVKTTKYQLNEIRIQTQRINQIRGAERRRANVSTERGTMGSVNRMINRDKKVNVNEIPKEAWESFTTKLNEMSMDYYYQMRSDIYKENYIKALRDNLGSYSDDIVDIINTMPSEELVSLYYLEPELQLDFAYSPEEEQQKATAILSALINYLEPAV